MIQKTIISLLLMVLVSPIGITTNDDTFTPKPKYMLLGKTSTIEQYKEVVIEEFGKDFIDTVNCESRFRHYNQDGSVFKSKPNKNGTRDWSWLQLNDVHRPIAKRLGITWESMTPGEAVLIAKEIMAKQGKDAWVCHWKK
jgi:hypothetical protein